MGVAVQLVDLLFWGQGGTMQPLVLGLEGTSLRCYKQAAP